MTRFAIVGAGWRSEFFLRIAQALPDHFEATGVLARTAEKGERLQSLFGVRWTDSLSNLLADKPDFVITSVSWEANPEFIRELSDLGFPVLAETPPAATHQDLLALVDLVKRGARVQVAEQYSFQPEHAARLAIVESGKLGDVFQAQVSVCHGYHGTSLIRKFLGIGYEAAKITARRTQEIAVKGPDRNGYPPKEEAIDTRSQLIGFFDFGDRQGVFDFVGTMYHSYIRSHRLLVRGPRGEINGKVTRYLQDFKTPIEIEIRRIEAGHTGNLDGHFLQGILGGSEWLYRNPFPHARLMDDEIAIADCMLRMGEYAQGGPDFYSLAEACQDHYLSILMEEAANSGQEVTAEVQPWA